MIPRADTPAWIHDILSWPWLWAAVRFALVSAYLIGGLTKLTDFAGAIAEQEHFGLHPGWVWAGLAVVVELGGSILVLCRTLGVAWRGWTWRIDRGRHGESQ